jgi:hypothetical protein
MIKPVEPTSKRTTPFGTTEPKDIYRKRKLKKCYCGWHSQGKESFNPNQTKHWKKNLKMHWRRLLRRYKNVDKEIKC